MLKKQELIAAIAARTGESKARTSKFLGALTDEISHQLCSGEEVSLPDIGRFGSKTRQARVGRNPSTGESISIQAREVVTFKAAKQLNDALNGNG